MRLILKVDFLRGVFSGEEVIPSPGRLLGALLSGAHSSGDDDVVKAIEEMAHCPQPDIIIPHYEHVINPESYSSGNPMTDGESRNRFDLSRIPMSDFGLHGGKVANGEHHATFISHVGYVFDGDIDRDMIAIAASHVGYLGKGGDFCVINVVDDDYASIPGMRYIHVPGSSAGMRLRVLSGGLVGHYNDNFDAINGGLRSSFSHTDHRISYGRWMRSEPLLGVDWVVIPTHKGFKQKEMCSILNAVQYKHSETPFPLIDNRGLVRGVAVPIDPENPVVDATSHHFRGSTPPVLKCQGISHWHGDDSYVSATPYIGHPDVRVAVWELENNGYVVEEIHREPFDERYQTDDMRHIPPAPIPYQRWWVRISGGHGIVREGHHTEEGFGLFVPVR